MLHVITGPMFSGKSSFVCHLAKTTPNAFVLKPAMDNRYSETGIVTHDGEMIPAFAIKAWPAIPSSVKTVIIDEVRFFERPNVDVELTGEIRHLLNLGLDVYAVGLDTDFKFRPFSVTASLLAMADNVTKLKSVCAMCGTRTATRTFKKKSGDKYATVEIGGHDIYEARCDRHHIVCN